MPRASLSPTLWRTCRVLANRNRLALLQALLARQPQSVSQLAEQLKLTLPATSQYLRALESRGFLKVNRVRRRVEYRLASPAESEHLSALLVALRAALRQPNDSPAHVFKLATGFTHPKRVEICRLLKPAPRPFVAIQIALKLSHSALKRHLHKLISRGYVVREQRHYHLATKLPPFADELVTLAHT
jgi:DNA-binding transcriptional ArsR family regulator